MSDNDDDMDDYAEEEEPEQARQVARQPPAAENHSALDDGILRQLELQEQHDLPMQQAQAPVLLRLLLTMFLDAKPSPEIEQHGRGVVGEEIDRQSAVMDIRMQQSMIRRPKFRALT
jgi:hypothetical protein